MKAIVNLLWCRPGQVGGSEEYLVRQLAGLMSVAPDIDLRLVVPAGFAAAHPQLLSEAGSVIAPRWPGGRLARIAAEARWLPRQLALADVVHHGGGTVPFGRIDVPVVLTVHDLQYRELPQHFSTARRQYLSRRMPRSAERAEVIAVPSEFVRGSVIEAFGVDASNVAVVPHGIDPPIAETLPERSAVRRRYGLEGRRVLVYPAITHPHKRHRFLVELLAGPWSDPDLVLVLPGGHGAADDDLEHTIARFGVGDRVRRPGRVPDADRDGLIALAEALVFPSEYEGFGAPVLEAMVLGTPVICSNRAALPEVVGDAAVVRPLASDAWADTLDVVAAERTGMIERGRRRAAHFTQAASGAALAAAYRLALGASVPGTPSPRVDG